VETSEVAVVTQIKLHFTVCDGRNMNTYEKLYKFFAFNFTQDNKSDI